MTPFLIVADNRHRWHAWRLERILQETYAPPPVMERVVEVMRYDRATALLRQARENRELLPLPSAVISFVPPHQCSLVPILDRYRDKGLQMLHIGPNPDTEPIRSYLIGCNIYGYPWVWSIPLKPRNWPRRIIQTLDDAAEREQDRRRRAATFAQEIV